METEASRESAVREELDRVLSSAGFSRTERLSRFLRFLVERHLEGKGSELKESVIAVDVFGRKAGYDPKLDAIVRTEALRLRARLERYYQAEGSRDAWIIELPKGGYRPVFRERATVAAGEPLRRRRPTAAAAVLALAMSAIAGALLFSLLPSARPRPARRLMLAVLPFENLTGDAGQDYFSDGLTEEMIAQFGRLDPEYLGVIARTSVMRYKQTGKTLREIGEELGVQYILEGTVRRDLTRVRVAAQLIHVEEQTHLWAHQYDRALTDLLTMQTEIAQEVAEAIQLTLDKRHIPTLEPIPLPTQAYEAYDAYLRGRYLWNKRTPEGFTAAIASFTEAISKNPNYAPAYAGLSDVYGLMASYGFATPAEVIPKARAAALKALELDDRLAEAHTSLGLITEIYDWDWQTSENEFRRAIDLNPNYATAHQWYAEYLAFRGRFNEALAEIDRARRLDPLSTIVATDTGAILYLSRQYDRAIEQLRVVLDIEPGAARAHMIVFAYSQKGQFTDALADIERWQQTEQGPWVWALAAYVYGRAGRTDDAQRAFDKMAAANRRFKLQSPIMLATAQVGMGRYEEAIASLQRAASEHSSALCSVNVDPIFDPLRADPRFRDALHRVGLAR